MCGLNRSIASSPKVYFLLAAMHGDDFAPEKQSMYRLKSSKEKTTFFVREWLRQKGTEKLCEIFESLYKLRGLYDQFGR